MLRLLALRREEGNIERSTYVGMIFPFSVLRTNKYLRMGFPSTSRAACGVLISKTPVLRNSGMSASHEG